MQTTTPPHHPSPHAHRRNLGIVGTIARLGVGVWMLGSVVTAHLAGPFNALAWLTGLIAFPALTIGWQSWRARHNPAPLRAIGPVEHLVNIAVFFVLWAAPWYAPAVGFLSDAALLFYGSSMLVAAWRGYRGCEVLAISNWLLHRDDQIGCLLFGPLDHVEENHSR